MDLDLLHIKLTAYALGELDMAQKAEIERILTESQDARDQVARAKAIAKAIKELLPQAADDVQPMTPAEYRARRDTGSSSMPPPMPEPIAPQAAVPQQEEAVPATAGQGLVWLLVVICILLAAGWLWQWKSSPAAPRQQMVPAAEVAAKDSLLKTLAQDLQKQKEAIEREMISRSELEATNVSLQRAKDALGDSVVMLESRNMEAELGNTALKYGLAQAKSAAEAFHQPFMTAQAQMVAVLPPTTANDTLQRIQDALKSGKWPLPSVVDPGELVQSLAYNYTAPTPGQKLPLLQATAAVCPWNEEHVLTRVTLTAGAEGARITSLQIEFNPTKVAAWRLIGREARNEAGALVGGQGCGELKPGTSLTLLCELVPAADPLAPLAARRADLLQKIEDAKRAVIVARDQTLLAKAKLQEESLRLDLKDLDAQIAQTKGVQKPGLRYQTPGQPTTAAALGDWLTVAAVVGDSSGQATPIEYPLRGAIKPFPEADADFRLAAAAAALGMVLHASPPQIRGQANLALVEALLKDLPADSTAVQFVGDMAKDAARTAAKEIPGDAGAGQGN